MIGGNRGARKSWDKSAKCKEGEFLWLFAVSFKRDEMAKKE
jgi:hypothetical protein